MIKKRALSFSIMLFLLMSYSAISEANINNPFTPKVKGEFTLEDQNRMKFDIEESLGSKITSLEARVSREIESLKRDVEAKNQQNNNSSSRNGVTSFEEETSFGNDLFGDEEENVVDLRVSMITNAKFIGCMDEQVILRDGKTKENFFVTIEEAKNNEEFNKVGNCNF